MHAGLSHVWLLPYGLSSTAAVQALADGAAKGDAADVHVGLPLVLHVLRGEGGGAQRLLQYRCSTWVQYMQGTVRFRLQQHSAAQQRLIHVCTQGNGESGLSRAAQGRAAALDGCIRGQVLADMGFS